MSAFIVSAVREHRIIAILRGVPPEWVADTAQALYEGGIRLLEITFNQSSPTRLEDTARSIRSALGRMAGGMLVGAGTVLTPEEADAAADAGATYILAPDTNPAVIETANRRGVAAIPGAMTPTEIAFAYRCGAAIVKLFPTGNLGTGYIRAVTAPLSHIPLLAVGGVDEHNLHDFLQAGVVGVGIGSNIVKNSLIAEGRFGELTELARRYTAALRE